MDSTKSSSMGSTNSQPLRAAVRQAIRGTRYLARSHWSKRLNSMLVGASCMLPLAIAAPAHGADFTWVGNLTTWDNPNSWSPNGVPGATDRAIFNSNLRGRGLAAPASIGQVVIQGTAQVFNNVTNPMPLTFYGIGGVGIDHQGSGGAIMHNAAALGSSQTWRVSNAAGSTLAHTSPLGGYLDLGTYTLTLDLVNGNNVANLGAVRGEGGIVKTGLGTLNFTFSSPNTYTGSTVVQAGTMTLSSSASISNSSVVELASGATFIMSNITAASTNIRSLAGGGSVVLGSKVLTLTNANHDFGGVIGGTGGLAIMAGRQILSGANTYLGGTSLNGGVLSIAADNALGDAAGTLSFNGGSLQNTAAFTSARAITLNPGNGVLQTDADLTLSGAITGTGALTKTGDATLTLTGNNAYGGGTTISAGTLQVGNGGTSGSLAGNIANEGTLALNRSDTLTLAGEISGSGAVNQLGTGTTILTSENSYTGATTISAGTLALSGAGSIAATSEVVANGTLDIAGTDTGASVATLSGSGAVVLGSKALTLTAPTGTFAGAIDGVAGTLNKGGASTWTLAGAGSELGTLNIQAGTLEVLGGASLEAQNTSITAGAILRNGGTLTGTVGGDTFALAGTFIGSASLLDGDDQVQIVDGADYSQAALDGGAGVDTLELASGGTLTLPLALTTGFENLVKRGNGPLTLAGTVDDFAERITVAEGTVNLQAAAVQTNELRIEPGVTLTGVGTLSGSFYNAGMLSPGNSPGVIHIAGNYTQDANGVLVSEILRTGTDLLDVGGAATLAGTRRIHVEYGLYLDGTTHTLIQAAGGITGGFASVEMNESALMTADRRLTANAETVTFTRQSFTSIGDQQSGRGRFAAWLEEQISAGQLSAEMTDYIDSLLQQPTAEGVEVLLGERGEPAPTTSQNSVSILGAGFARTVFDRFTLSDSVQCSPTQQASNDAISCFWANGLRQWGQAGGGTGYDWTSDGGQIGVDRSLSSSWAVGGTFGYADTNTRDLSGGHNEVRSKMGGLYASYAPGRLSLGVMAFYSGNDNSTRRNVLIGSTQQHARADFDSDSYGAGIRLSYRVTDEAGPLVRPFIEAFYDHIEAARFSERNAGEGNLSAHVHGRDGLRGTLGLQLAESFEGYGRVFRPALEVGVAHQFEDARSTIDLQPFSDAPSFRTYGPALDRTAYIGRASLNVSLGAHASMALGYGGEIADDYSQHEGNLSFRVAW